MDGKLGFVGFNYVSRIRSLRHRSDAVVVTVLLKSLNSSLLSSGGSLEILFIPQFEKFGSGNGFSETIKFANFY